MIIKEPKSALDIDLDYYRKFNDDLATLNNEQLLNHYIQYGRAEGRSNHMCKRDFVFSIPRNNTNVC